MIASAISTYVANPAECGHCERTKSDGTEQVHRRMDDCSSARRRCPSSRWLDGCQRASLGSESMVICCLLADTTGAIVQATAAAASGMKRLPSLKSVVPNESGRSSVFGDDIRNRCCAIPIASRSWSPPTNRLLVCRQATAVVPDPASGSQTRDPGSLNDRSQCSTSGRGFCHL